MSDLTVRSLYPEDIDQVSEVESRLTGRPRKAFLESLLAAATAEPDSFVTCAAVDNKKLVGYGFARILEGEFGAQGTTVELETIGVDLDYQGRGIGKKVMAGIEQRMKRKNLSTLQTQIIWSNHNMTRFFASTGFALASGQIIERDTSPLGEEIARVAPVDMAGRRRVHNTADCNYYETLARGRVIVRPLTGDDLVSVDRIDTKLTGLDRSAFYAAKFRESVHTSGIRFSMVAEDDGIVTGFIMARTDFGEFGKVNKYAVLDAIGVHPVYGGSGIGHALLSQLLTDLSALEVESVRTKMEHGNFGLRNFLTKRGFKPSQRLLLSKKTN
ncbi:GNAT family N-acetyltransferase [Geobacter argillaceus]|uniref:Ribosomal protein S18 acetylase RimI-like enzyme n=1 Tax=Geobacter argillaceus TaxID=345631 RepID=A0A562VNC1_9BACT|nr:GNAT family N-acetyltransferase [Geobacter argillaceus]TWJ19400.1 ribosomal protein S18 acetylase RimI-like enzyme [Geobacter argillaceus]